MAKKTKQESGSKDPRSHLPSVAVLLEQPAIVGDIALYSRPLVLDAINGALAWYRKNLKAGDAPPDLDGVVAKVRSMLNESERDRIRPVVNASGIILHTGLGRAVLPQRAVDALAGLNRCVNLQIDMETGLRGKRNFTCEQLLCKLTGAEAAMLVNNNAGATLLVLAALCAGKEVIVSRGQLIEIGGSFRLPDCIHQSGARLVEVGTTNKTHLRDYEAALSENTGAILRVNPSNYRIVGFTKDVSIAELVTLKQKRPDLIVLDDLGCGALVGMERFGLPHEPTVPDSIAAGADISFFSGDKLIGGPQAGAIVGRKDLISKIEKHPLTRMLRVCKLTDLALEQTLRLFLDPDTLPRTNPTYAMLTAKLPELKQRAERLKEKIDETRGGLKLRVIEGESATGGGSLPDTPIKTWLVAVSSPTTSAERLNALLRQNEPPIIARIESDEVLLDMRTLLDGEEKIVLEALTKLAEQRRAC